MALIDDIRAAFPNITAANRDDGAIAASLSVGRLKTVSPTLIGIGSVLKTLGPTDGAAFLDALEALAATNSVVKWGLAMIKDSKFDIGDPLSVAQVNTFVGTLLTSDQAATLINLAVVPDPISPQMVEEALAGHALP